MPKAAAAAIARTLSMGPSCKGVLSCVDSSLLLELFANDVKHRHDGISIGGTVPVVWRCSNCDPFGSDAYNPILPENQMKQ